MQQVGRLLHGQAAVRYLSRQTRQGWKAFSIVRWVLFFCCLVFFLYPLSSWAVTGDVSHLTTTPGVVSSSSSAGDRDSSIVCGLIASGYDVSLTINNAPCSSASGYTFQWTHNDIPLAATTPHSCAITLATGGQLHVDVLSGETVVCDVTQTISSLIVETDDSVDDMQLSITEIHPKDDTHPEYIELLLIGSYDGEVWIDGLGRGRASKSIDLTDVPAGYIIVTDSVFLPETLLHGATIRTLSSISLTDGGQSLTLRTADKTLQTISYPAARTDNSMYPDETDTTLFSQIAAPTPGAPYTPDSSSGGDVGGNGNTGDTGDDTDTPPIDDTSGSGSFVFVDPACSIAWQHDTPVAYGKKINLITKRSGSPIQNSSRSYSCQIDMGDGTIYDKCNPDYHTYTAAGLYVVRTRIGRGDDVCYASTVINYPAASSASSSRTNSSSSTSSSSYRDKYDELLQQITESGYRRANKKIRPINDENIRDRLAMTGVIAIAGLLPDAIGKDTDQEGLRLTNMTGASYDLSGSYLLVGSSKKRLAGVIDPQTSQTFIQTRGLRNSAGCVYLMSADDLLLDQFCYTATTAGERIEHSDHRFHIDPRLQRAGLHLYDNVDDQSVCLQYGGDRDAVLLACQPYASRIVMTGDQQAGSGDVIPHSQSDTSDLSTTQCLDMSSLSGEQLFSRLLPYVAGSGSVSIASVLPNPDGPDAGAEKIAFRSLGDKNISLSGYSIRSGKKTTSLPDDLVALSTHDMMWTGSLGLKNSANCVYLFDDHGRLEDQFCYDRAPSGVTLTGSAVRREGHPLFVWSGLRLLQEDDEVCLLHGTVRMRCVSGYDSATVDKQLASYEKKATRAQAKYEKQKEKYAQCVEKKKELDAEDKRQRKAIRERVAKQQKKNTERLRRYNEKNKKISAQMREQRATNRLLDDYVDSVTAQLRDDAYDAGEYDKALRRTDVYETIDTQIASGAERYRYGRVDVDIDDVDSVYTLYSLEHDVVVPLRTIVGGDTIGRETYAMTGETSLYHSAMGDTNA